MAELPYLLRLTATLADAVSDLPATFRRCHGEYLRRCQNEDGGFGGREGASDLYYTAFALRGLAVLQELTPDIAERAAAYLRKRRTGSAQVVDFFSFLYAALLVETTAGISVVEDVTDDWPQRVAALLESFAAPDGGYAKVPGGVTGSTYQTFLVALCYEILGRELPRPAEVIRFVRSRQREDGGFVDIAPMKRSGTNPTAAAVALLQMTASLDAATRQSVAALLLARQSSEGGLTANARIPTPDLLSTFTGCWTLRECHGLHKLNRDVARRYLQSLARPAGGFRGGSWDHDVDVEYTFYGIAACALLQSENTQSERE
jgi:geranylgeranyl transferase type-2 subunit beta